LKRNVVILAFALSAILIAALGFYRWKADAPRREALSALQEFSLALNSNNSSDLLAKIALPQALQGRTEFEQLELLRKALHDEISDEGVAKLARPTSTGQALLLKQMLSLIQRASLSPRGCSSPAWIRLTGPYSWRATHLPAT
jgi:hypothetical protein